MSANSSIEWTDASWNPIAAFLTRNITAEIGGKKVLIPKGTRGWFCVKCSPGCLHCYAEGINLRLGNGLEYLHRNLADIEFRLVNLEAPLSWRKPRMVFVNSMTDLFLEHIPIELIAPIFAVMALAGQHTFQVLTKRAERMRTIVSVLDIDRCVDALSRVVPGVRLPPANVQREMAIQMRAQGRNPDAEQWPLPNVWLGVSVEDQARADERIPKLIGTPAIVRFLSCEPLLGPIDLTIAKYFRDANTEPAGGWFGSKLSSVDWVIVGGESGPHSRCCDTFWIDRIVEQCRAASVPVFVKQLGANPVLPSGERIPLRDRKGGDPAEWPVELRVRQFPDTAHRAVATTREAVAS
jgi:protein gp37